MFPRQAQRNKSYVVFENITNVVFTKGIVKTTTPFVNATTLVICSHVIWDFTRDVGVS